MNFETFDLTQSQQGIMSAAERVGNRCLVYRLNGAIDEDKLSRSIQALVDACAPFSYRFLRINESMQILQSPTQEEALRIINATNDDTVTFSIVESLCRQRFRLDGGAPYIFALVKSPHHKYLVFSCHPALMDRFSLKPLMKFLSAIYNSSAHNPGVKNLGIPQDVLLTTERALLTSPDLQENMRFWLQLVRSTSFEWQPPRIENGGNENYFSTELTLEQSAELKRLASQLGIEDGPLLLFCFHILMYKVCRNDTVLTSYFRRIHTTTQGIIGFNEHKLALKSIITADLTTSEFFKRAAGLMAQMQFHAKIPALALSDELRRLEPAYQRSTNLLFTRDCLPYTELALKDVSTQLLPVFSYRLEEEDVAVHFDIREKITFHVVARTHQTVPALQLIFEHFKVLLADARDKLDCPIGDLSFYNQELKQTALKFANGGPLPTAATDVMKKFEEAAAQHKTATAISYDKTKYTYQEFFQISRQISAGLMPICQQQNALIGICLPRNEQVVFAIFGVLGAGMGYVPLDPDMPIDRLKYIIGDAKLSAVIVNKTTQKILQSDVALPLPTIEELRATSIPPQLQFPVEVSPETTAYVIYTSGTTGYPKGVVITRGNLAHLMASLDAVWEKGPGRRFLHFASFSFDASVMIMFYPLINGSEVVIVPSELRTDPAAIFQLMLESQISHADLPPAMLPLLPRRPLPDLKVIIAGGEAIDEDAVRFWSKAVCLANCYGPTETTVMCTWNRLEGGKAANQLGRPIPGYFTYLLDEKGHLAPLGGIGEICIGGNAVGKEYLGKPELTMQKFMQNGFGPGRLYRTGDLGRYTPNGELEFLGRCDFQVKIRGFRIELGDIETAISKQPEVKMAYVGIVEREGSKALTAWYVGKNLPVTELRGRLGKLLPHYMVPTFLLNVDNFPLTLNGKIDRTRLPLPSPESEADMTANMDSLQLKVRKIWADVLKLSPTSIGYESHFFHMGGHSLLAAAVVNRLTVALGTHIKPRLLFEYPQFSRFCDELRELSQQKEEFKPIVATTSRNALVENSMIGLMYSRAINLPDDNTYNIVSTIAFSKEIRPELLQAAFWQILDQNPIFKSAFIEQDGNLYIQENLVKLPEVPCLNCMESDIAARAEAMRSLVLGITQAPLWKAEILLTEKGACSLLFCIHHGVFDGWSLNLFMEELSQRYQCLESKEQYQLQRLNIFDYSAWTEGISTSKEFLKSVQYWRKKLTGASAKVEMPHEFNQKRGNSNRDLSLYVGPTTVKALKKLADDFEVTLSPLLFSIFLTWLWRITSQDDLVVGYPYAGRDLPGLDEIYGAFVKVGFLRKLIDPQQNFRDLARAVHQQMIEDKDHFTAAPYDAKIPGMDAMNVIFSLQSGIGLAGKFGSADYKAEELPSLTAKGDISGIFYENLDGSLAGRIEYDGAFFRTETMRGFIKILANLIESTAARGLLRVAEIAYLSYEEQSRLLAYSLGPVKPSLKQSIPARFEQVVKQHGDKIALEFRDIRLSYAELDERSTKVARALSSQIRSGEMVGLCMEKSDEAIAVIFALLKLGAVYVPLDPTYPKERLKFFVENCHVKNIVADGPGQEKIVSCGLTDIRFVDTGSQTEGGIPPPVKPDALAYIIHTSGSTGIPKGVMIEHHSVVRLAVGVTVSMNFDTCARSLLYGPLSFDTSIIEMFLPLLNGGTLVIVPEEKRKDPAALHGFFKENRISHAVISPVMMQNLPREPLPDLKIFGFGGDTIDEATADFWCRQTRLFSCYGPTEITVQSSIGEILPGSNPRIIGKPDAYYRMYLLNPLKQFVPMGAIGEIYIGGEQCARGYIGRDDLTMERFVLDAFADSPYARMYRTGDLGRFMADGTIEYMGRNDGQVKLRGFRIELGEIENRLSVCPGILQVVCAIKGEGQNRYLAAYYVAEKDLNADDLRTELSKYLPDYMVPTFFVHLDSIPASINGKVDRKALPAVTVLAVKNPPHEGLERQIAAIWEQLLGIKGISRDDSFFHLGGNSLTVVRLQHELRGQLDLHVAISDIYTGPTIEALAAGQAMNVIEMAVHDAGQGVTSENPAERLQQGVTAKNVLLTGARGFLGIFLLAELSAQVDLVHCLLRCADEDAGKKALQRESEAAGVTINFDRVKVIPGDLNQPELGLNAEIWEKLAHDVDVIFHCGAFVHHLHTYTMMKNTNVEGTKQLIRLALRYKQKPFCFVSTLAVGAALEQIDHIHDAVIPNRPITTSGYILTKWVAEQLLADAFNRYGLPCLIARPGNITGSTATGFSNYANNHFWLFNRGCFQLQAFPDLEARVEMMPVDVLAKNITTLALHLQTELFVANLVNPQTITRTELFEFAATAGLKAEKMEVAKWQQLLNDIKEDNALFTIKDFYTGDLSGSLPNIAQEQLMARLNERHGILSIDYKQILPVYISYLMKEGFLK